MVKISLVNYLNSFPFKFGLENFKFIESPKIEFDIPSVCAKKLIEKQVDIGLVPVAILPQLNYYELVSDFCISANGPVDSVKVYSHHPIEEISELILDYHSRTSAQLVKILCREKWKINPVFLPSDTGYENSIIGTRAGLVIGDRTFEMNGRFPFEYDLSLEWKTLTGLPFVFAVWVSNRPIEDENFINQLNQALKFGVQNIEKSIVDYKSVVPNFDPAFYLKKRIEYEFSSEKKQAMEKFLAMILY